MIRVCIAGRNHAAFTEQCLASILSQAAEDVAIDWTDDASSDNGAAFAIAARLVGGPPAWHRTMDDCCAMTNGLHRLEQTAGRRGGLENLWRAALRAGDDDICVIVGGDDWLEPHALHILREEYRDPECWLTYGQMKNTEGPSEFQAYEWDGLDPRAQKFVWAPLTVRAKLLRKVLEDDLKMGGWFFPAGGDVALNIPLVEMAGPERCHFIAEPWFNRRIHAGNDHNSARKLQDFCGWTALCKPRYGRLASLDDAPTRTPHVLGRSIIFTPQHDAGHLVEY